MEHSSVSPELRGSVVGTTDNLRRKLEEALSALDSMPTLPPRFAPGETSKLSERDVVAIREARSIRSKFFGDDIFADPAWDLLLELYAAELGQRRITVTALSESAVVPASTGLRWLKILEERGFVSRHADPLNGRKSYARLSRTGLQSMDEYFANCGQLIL